MDCGSDSLFFTVPAEEIAAEVSAMGVDMTGLCCDSGDWVVACSIVCGVCCDWRGVSKTWF